MQFRHDETGATWPPAHAERVAVHIAAATPLRRPLPPRHMEKLTRDRDPVSMVRADFGSETRGGMIWAVVAAVAGWGIIVFIVAVMLAVLA